MTHSSKKNGSAPKATLRAHIVADLKQQIDGRALLPGHQLPPILTLCEQYGVSDITVRAALRDLRISGHIESRRGSGIYVRSAGVPSLSGENAIALLVGSWDSPFYAGIIRGVEDECRRAGFRCILACSNYDWDVEAQYLRELSGQVAGLMVMPLVGEHNYAAYAELLAQHRPFVFIDSYKAGIAAPLVSTNNEKGGYMATKHLLEAGCAQVYALCGEEHTSFQERLDGYRRALKELGAPREENLIRRGTHRPVEAGYELTRDILNQRSLSSARIGLFCFNDAIARGAYLAIREAKLRIPEDVALVGFDDSDAQYFDPPLSSIRQDTHELGAAGARLLLERLRPGANGNGSTPGASRRSMREIRIEPELVIRSSSDKRSEFCLATQFAQNIAHRRSQEKSGVEREVLLHAS
jgi:LacI family transcriptional regulator